MHFGVHDRNRAECTIAIAICTICPCRNLSRKYNDVLGSQISGRVAGERGNQRSGGNQAASGAKAWSIQAGVLSSSSPSANLVGRPNFLTPLARRSSASERWTPRTTFDCGLADDSARIGRAFGDSAHEGSPVLCAARQIARCLVTLPVRLPAILPLPRGESFAPFDPSHRRQQRDVHVHLLLADGGRGALRPGQHGLLHRRHRGRGDRPGGPLVHPGRDALQLLRALDLYRKLLALRPRRRLPRGQGGHGRVPRQALGLGPDVRLHPHRADQRRFRRVSTS